MPQRHILGVVVLLLIVSAVWAAASRQSSRSRSGSPAKPRVQKAIADFASPRSAPRTSACARRPRLKRDERIARDSAQRDANSTKASAKDAADARAQAHRRPGASGGRQRHTHVHGHACAIRCGDPELVEIRNAQLVPKRNGMCAEFNIKDKNGRYTAGFKRVVVTDARVAPEEPPVRETLTQFLVFQIAARDTGCFPDVAADPDHAVARRGAGGGGAEYIIPDARMSTAALPADVDAVVALLEQHDYFSDRRLATSVFLALKLRRPLFLEGEAGVGKTEIAKVLAARARALAGAAAMLRGPRYRIGGLRVELSAPDDRDPARRGAGHGRSRGARRRHLRRALPDPPAAAAGAQAR